MTMKELEGRVAVVTGGSRGIGQAIALALARHGASLAICYREREAPAKETKALLQREGTPVFVARCAASRAAT